MFSKSSFRSLSQVVPVNRRLSALLGVALLATATSPLMADQTYFSFSGSVNSQRTGFNTAGYGSTLSPNSPDSSSCSTSYLGSGASVSESHYCTLYDDGTIEFSHGISDQDLIVRCQTYADDTPSLGAYYYVNGTFAISSGAGDLQYGLTVTDYTTPSTLSASGSITWGVSGWYAFIADGNFRSCTCSYDLDISK